MHDDQGEGLMGVKRVTRETRVVGTPKTRKRRRRRRRRKKIHSGSDRRTKTTNKKR